MRVKSLRVIFSSCPTRVIISTLEQSDIYGGLCGGMKECMKLAQRVREDVSLGSVG